MNMYKYPYQNRSTEDMESEVWKPIAGYDGKVHISSLGRVKSFSKSAKGAIIAARVYRQGEKPLLAFKVSINDVEKEYRTAAIVYNTFIEELDFKVYNIEYVDGNSLNLHPSNLKAFKRRKQVMKEKKYHKQQLIAATASMYKYPCQNLSLVDMEGEIWKPFPELPDHYAVSNKGRVKSLEREYTTVDGKKYTFESQILKQRVQVCINPITKEEYQHLSVNSCIDYIKREFTISRLVYEAFIAPIDKNNQKLIVRHKDSNHFNNTPENLYLTDQQELLNYLLKTGRRNRLVGSSDMSRFTHEDWKARYDTIRKPVSQFDLDGRFIRTFESREQAARSMGLSEIGSVSSAIYGRVRTLGGYQWRSGIDQTPMKPVIIPNHLRKAFQAKKIAKYDLDGNLLDVYPSITVAARENNIKLDRLYSYVRNPDRVPRKGKMFFWKYVEEKVE
ncbi:MAG TPA: hypothetical protein DEQ30_01965 [Porphyromonadaceae bacterium]|nr:hypothetical protein [Porphyromonadaceae bacterium]